MSVNSKNFSLEDSYLDLIRFLSICTKRINGFLAWLYENAYLRSKHLLQNIYDLLSLTNRQSMNWLNFTAQKLVYSCKFKTTSGYMWDLVEMMDAHLI